MTRTASAPHWPVPQAFRDLRAELAGRTALPLLPREPGHMLVPPYTRMARWDG